jgi:hypothetical protein
MEIETKIISILPGQTHHLVMRVLVDPFIGHGFMRTRLRQWLRRSDTTEQEEEGREEDQTISH